MESAAATRSGEEAELHFATHAASGDAARKAKREHREQTAVQLRPQYPDVDESVAVHSALSKGAGSVTLSSKPVAGDDAPEPGERQGLG